MKPQTQLLSACPKIRLRVAQATRLCRPATRRTERERWFETKETVFSQRCAPSFRLAGRQPGRASRPRYPYLAAAALFRPMLGFLLLIANGWSGAGHAQPAPSPPLVHAHAHNDYVHKRPLLDALDHGICSVEADIFLVEDKLLVAHNRQDVKPERTLQALYLDPLRERVRRNGGRVFPGGPEFNLLIDLKTDWHNSYPALRSVLTNYGGMLSTFSNGAQQEKAVTVIISGNRAKEMFDGEAVRFAAYDGLLADLDSSAADWIPWISSSWSPTFQWRGKEAMPEEEVTRLKAIVSKAHTQGRRVRFWGAPDTENFWKAMRAADVDLINTDDLAGVERFLRSLE